MRLACWRRRPAFADFPAKIVSVQSHARGFWGAQAETVFSNRCDNSTDCCRQAAGNCGLAARAPQNTEREMRSACAPETSVGHSSGSREMTDKRNLAGDFRCLGLIAAKNQRRNLFLL